MLTLIDSTTIHSMTQHQVSDALGNIRAGKDEGGNKEGSRLTKTYQDFISSKPRSFYGDRGVDSVIHWIKEIERKCAGEHRAKFATCTFMGRALLWWSIQVKGLGIDEANATPGKS